MDIQLAQRPKPMPTPAVREVVRQFHVEVLSHATQLAALGGELAKLDGAAACPMQSYAWVQACADSFNDDSQSVVILRCNDEIVAYAALAEPHGSSRSQCIGHQLFEPTMFAYADDASCRELANAVVNLNKRTFLRDVYATSAMADAFKTACAGRRICIQRPMPAHPWLKLDQSWLDPEQHLNSGRRSDLRRARRQAEKQGTLTFRIETLTPENVDARMEEVFEVETRNWKGRSGSSMASMPAIQSFYRAYARRAAEQGIARVLTMHVGDVTVAVQFGVIFNQRFWLLKMGYDETFSRCSPGMLLMVESLRYATECGLEIYEMMGVRETWNQVWTESAHEALSLRIYSSGISGLIGAGSEMVRAGLRKAAERRRKKK